MCGIVGVVNFKKSVAKKKIKSMADKLTHRGPDEEGYFLKDNMAFGFKRLSIVDLNHGQQPMFFENLVLVCNGEIYNHHELREELKDKYTFKTECDVEVILYMYKEYGEEFVKRLNGQFAIAIYNRDTKEIFLARDHVGITPLFYTLHKNRFIFASEIKAILEYTKAEIDPKGLDQVLTFPGLTAPQTIFKNIKSLQAGHYLKFKKKNYTLHKYWDLDYPLSVEDKGKEYYLEKLDYHLKRAVSLRLNADVDVGFYLSGGLDSSLIASLIHKLVPDMQRDSYSISFSDSNIDESPYQELMAKEVNSNHHTIHFGWSEIASRLKEMVYHAEAPLKESYNTCSLALSASVRENGKKVILTGEGADELFGGYVGYRLGSKRESGFDMDSILEDEITQKLWGDSGFFYEKEYAGFNEFKELFYSDKLLKKLHKFNSTENDLVDLSQLEGRDFFHKRSYIDFKVRLSEHLLADHGDRVCYANSIEARYPFLDVELIEFIKTIPVKYMIFENKEKYILNEYAKDYVPSEITDREKFAFVAPNASYLLKQDIEWINKLLDTKKIKKEGFFNPDMVENLKQRYLSDDFVLNQTFENDFLMFVLTFEILLEEFDIKGYKDDK
ncbi:asparagine synthase (glutamine-hydrolyzing) [Sulfurovum sp. bin170]|uniref:asparagine synthase (glutamine-hydrolyzing) n=1 Tax=Sulfurovum sp. bin170 TaxID=2695268 RepID=UPI0013DE9954|nr:asparagine synthase (glutamine-hydrolyzing) [Sulfurovum sp. bin170]NEW61421.1 asparagine synthase (glutamine-hydrolyzing) [Sulfurovum sp. bin170]